MAVSGPSAAADPLDAIFDDFFQNFDRYLAYNLADVGF